MKKIFGILCVGSITLLAASCGGNKTADNDSIVDTMEVVEEISVDSVAPDSVELVEAEEVVDEASAAAKNAATTATKAASTATKAAGTAVKAAGTAVKEEAAAVETKAKTASEKAAAAVQSAAKKGQQAAENGIDDVAARAKAAMAAKKAAQGN